MRPAKHSLQIQSRHVVGSRLADPIKPSSARRRLDGGEARHNSVLCEPTSVRRRRSAVASGVS